MADYNFIELAKNAKQASKKLATLSIDIKNKALLSVAEALDVNKTKIFVRGSNLCTHESTFTYCPKTILSFIAIT